LLENGNCKFLDWLLMVPFDLVICCVSCKVSKQSISIVLKELEEEGILERKIIKQKPLHIEYNLSPKGKSLVPVFQQMENLLS
jgi:DNA-binding PadR family transcriptional regulator